MPTARSGGHNSPQLCVCQPGLWLIAVLSAAQVIDGALAATKAQLEKLEAEKEAWEAHVSQMQSEHEAEVSSLSHQLATLRSGLAEAAHAAPGEPSEILAVKAELISLQVLILPYLKTRPCPTYTGMQLCSPITCNAKLHFGD